MKFIFYLPVSIFQGVKKNSQETFIADFNSLQKKFVHVRHFIQKSIPSCWFSNNISKEEEVENLHLRKDIDTNRTVVQTSWALRYQTGHIYAAKATGNQPIRQEMGSPFDGLIRNGVAVVRKLFLGRKLFRREKSYNLLANSNQRY